MAQMQLLGAAPGRVRETDDVNALEMTFQRQLMQLKKFNAGVLAREKENHSKCASPRPTPPTPKIQRKSWAITKHA
eukprot:2794652-Pyramimonas_sp.AAC.2